MKLTLILTTLFASSVNTLTLTNPSQSYNADAASKCKSQGGSYSRQGLMGNYGCVKNYSDAFRPCRSSDDCLGDCIIEDGGHPVAFCQPSDGKFGCWATIQDWNVHHGIICRD